MTPRAEARGGFFESPLARALSPAAWVYGQAAIFQRRRKERKAVRLSCPVLSVGNITCGGTGKTPTVARVVTDWLALGRRPAILSRGYGARDLGRGNDERQVLDRALPGVLHLQGRDRVALGREAISRGADALVLDDGFQHVRLARDVDLVLLDALEPFGHGRTLPAGLLREPLDVLREATLFALTRPDQVRLRTLTTLRSYLRSRFPGIPQCEIQMKAAGWCALGAAGSVPSGALEGRSVLAFCGIGNPEAFRRQLLALGLEPRVFLTFPDHHPYSPGDLASIARQAAQRGLTQVVMTEKDAVKIAPGEGREAWRYLRIEAHVSRGEDAYAGALSRALEGGDRHAT